VLLEGTEARRTPTRIPLPRLDPRQGWTEKSVRHRIAGASSHTHIVGRMARARATKCAITPQIPINALGAFHRRDRTLVAVDRRFWNIVAIRLRGRFPICARVVTLARDASAMLHVHACTVPIIWWRPGQPQGDYRGAQARAQRTLSTEILAAVTAGAMVDPLVISALRHAASAHWLRPPWCTCYVADVLRLLPAERPLPDP
jgi:hypothetical protein